MKVIQNNAPQYHFPLRVVCSYCKSVLEANANDLKDIPADPFRNESGYQYVECPVCRHKNAVEPTRPATAQDYYSK